MFINYNTSIAKTAFAKQQAQLFTWGGYDDPGLYSGYIEKHGGDPEYSIFGDAEEGFKNYVQDM